MGTCVHMSSKTHSCDRKWASCLLWFCKRRVYVCGCTAKWGPVGLAPRDDTGRSRGVCRGIPMPAEGVHLREGRVFPPQERSSERPPDCKCKGLFGTKSRTIRFWSAPCSKRFAAAVKSAPSET